MSTSTFRNILRMNKILTTFIKYGFGGLVSELRVFPFFFFLKRLFIFGKIGGAMSTPVRVRLMLEELGPTFIKLGQVVSTRADLLPPDWLDEFKKLQDAVPPFSSEVSRRMIERALNARISERFAAFEDTPVASASIAQVHYAELFDGTLVAVKVKRPGIEKIIEADISVMYMVARLLHKHVPASRRYRPIEVVDEFSRVIHNELDLMTEGSNAARFLRMFKNNPFVKIPRVYWDYTTEGVLTMERVVGIPLDEVERIKEKGLDIKKIAANGIKVFFEQVFMHGVFHADLHPGNIFTTDDGVIIYLDFGIVGRLDKDLRRYLASILFYLIRQDYHRMAVVHREMGLIGKDIDLHEFEDALRDITEPLFGKTLEEINMSTLLLKLIQTARRFKMKLQPNLLLLQKSMVIIEGVGRQLYPDINIWAIAKPLIYKWMLKEKFSPKNYVDKGREFTEELASTLFELPSQMHSLLTAALKDELKVGFVHYRLEPLSDGINTASRKISGAIIAGALIIASALIHVFAPEDTLTLFGLPALSFFGFVIAGVIGLRQFFQPKMDRDEEEL